ncbi:MAG TPA: helix-turn-helix domain-containing protein [Polyangia bacterium]|nr:helix-turn-helix domain-containing protein [Polyangia bacterium]
MNKKHLGSTLHSFLAAEGLLDDAVHLARKKVIADQIAREMKRRDITPSMMAKSMGTSRTVVYRLLKADEGVTLDVLERASQVLGRDLVVKLVARRPTQIAARAARRGRTARD